MVKSRRILLRMRNVSDRSCKVNQNTHFVFKKKRLSENLAVCDAVRKNMVQPDRPQMAMPNTKGSEYVILIAFQCQQWLCEHT